SAPTPTLMPAANYANLSLAFHHAAPSLGSSVGSVGLGSAWEASGAGSDFGGSTSRRPSGKTISRTNLSSTPTPPSVSDVFSVVGSTFDSSEAYAELFSRPSATK